MQRKPLTWKLFPIFFVITLFSILIVGLYATNTSRMFYLQQVEDDLIVNARLVRSVLYSEDVPMQDQERLQSLIKSLSEISETRLTVIDTSGVVLAESERDPQGMENHADRPEIKEAIEGKTGVDRRISPTLSITMVYAAVPIERNGEVVGVLRSSFAAKSLDEPQAAIFNRIVLGAALVAIIAGIASLLAARRITEPLLEMKRAAARFANGDFRSRVPLPDSEEFASLADTLNRMASQLDRQVRTITRQAGEQQAILSSMKEAVIAIDNDDRILILNATAEQLLNVSLDDARGKTIQEVIRNPEIQKFFIKTRESDGPISDEIVFRVPEERILQAVGTALVDSDDRNIGVLVVLNDVTQTRRLENMRKEFVANVSHELKTPITSIKGFVETLSTGAIDDPEKAREFLAIVSRQADRLTAIIEDILALSRIEQDVEMEEIAMQESLVEPILNAAAMNCDPKARENNTEIIVDVDPELTATLNAPLMEQAVTNLVDNAVKYTPGGTVRIVGEQANGDVLLRVIDNGAGIEPEHIPRLFERFYRVDKARSRKMGGTGLGLAIVKHIVNAHQGTVEVQSKPGQGSTFTIHLKKYPQQPA